MTAQNGTDRAFQVEALNNAVKALNKVSNQLSYTQLVRGRNGSGGDLLDPRRDIAGECGWPKNPTVEQHYGPLFEEDGVAYRVVCVYPDESWSVYPEVYETENDGSDTPFETRWNELLEQHNFWHYLHRLDVVSGIGRFGALLMGFDDVGENGDLSKSVTGINLDGSPRLNKRETQLLYLRAFDETSVRVDKLDDDPRSARHGLPLHYDINFADVQDSTGTVGVNQKVHWSRVLHAADNLRQSEVFGVPRMKPVLSRIADIRKILGGSAEMFWLGAFPGFSFETIPEVVDSSELDLTTIKDQIEGYVNGLRRYMALEGMTAKALTPQAVDPEGHVTQQLRAICTSMQVPLRIFTGSEAAHLASTQDSVTWNRRLLTRQKLYLEPRLIRPFINRLVAVGALPKPAKSYKVNFTDFNAISEKDRADVALKRAQAMLQYATGGVETVISPLFFLTEILGVPLPRARAVLAARKEDRTRDVWKQPEPPPPGAGAAAGATKKPARNALGGRRLRG